MDSIRNFCNPNMSQLEIEVVDCIMNEVSVARGRGDWIKVVALTVITELAAIFCAITNVFTTLGLAVYEDYSRGSEAAGQVLINGVKAEGYILATAIAFTGIVIFAPETLPSAGLQLGNDRMNEPLQLRQRETARIRDLATERVAYQGEIGQLNARIGQLEGENRRLREVRPVVDQRSQEQIRRLTADLNDMIRGRELEIATARDDVAGPLRNQIAELQGRIRNLEIEIQNLNGEVGTLEGNNVCLLSRLQEQGVRIHANNYTRLMVGQNQEPDTKRIEVTLGQLRGLVAS